ncbi:Exocyst complex component EXO84B [Quillaja saponaria]|uniref:Exocyst complex component EXO84B n=1 Tax=Quillaja saponaria TaxID=32244 RepID=A0AAD7Q984_QUISA|nr:Exocyst complex component EXO84B [Quillaja saponaria]
MKILSKETIHAIIEDDACAVPPPPSELEVHINDVSETLDTLLSENRIDEALTILECEDENFQGIQFENNFPSHELMLYISAISERKDMLILQLTLIADNPRVAAPELQKALAGLCRLGDSHLAVQLLLKYYRSHIVRGTYNLEHSKSSLHGIYIRELAKFVFSMISQAARSFVMLCGESSTYDSELMQWAREETQVFVTCFNKYLKSVSERSGALSTVVEAVQFALSFCSLLETQKLVLRPYLVKHLRPFLEEFLHIHINHFKKVVAIFSVSDNWELGRYLASGIFGEGCFSVVVGQPLQYCLLTNSGRKFLTLLQAITEDVSPLVSLQMGGSVLGELRNLFMEYVVILESALTWDTSMAEKDGGSRINLAESMLQQVSVLANLSTLVGFLTVMVKNIFRSINHTDSEIMGNHSGGHQQTEHENFIQFIEEASNQLRDIFYQKFILRVLSTESSHVPTGDIHNDGHCDSSVCLTPSGILQVFFLELRKLEQLAEENVFELDWLMDLFRELMEAIFVWASKNKLIQATSEENMTMEDTDDSKQFVLDVQFLVEIAMYGGYFSINPLLLVSLMKSTFRSAGLYPIRDVNNDGWAIAAATKTIQKLLELEKTTLPPNKETRGILEEELHTKQSDYAGYYSQEDALSSSENYVDWEEAVATDESGVSIHAEMAPLKYRI